MQEINVFQNVTHLFGESAILVDIDGPHWKFVSVGYLVKTVIRSRQRATSSFLMPGILIWHRVIACHERCPVVPPSAIERGFIRSGRARDQDGSAECRSRTSQLSSATDKRHNHIPETIECTAPLLKVSMLALHILFSITMAYHLQILFLSSSPKDGFSLIDEIWLVPDVDNHIVYHLVLSHILDDMGEVIIPRRPVSIISRKRSSGVLRAISSPQIMNEEDEVAIVITGGSIVVQNSCEASLQRLLVGIHGFYGEQGIRAYLVLTESPDPTTTRSRNLSPTRSLIIPANIGEELVWDLMRVVWKSVEGTTGELCWSTSIVAQVYCACSAITAYQCGNTLDDS